MIDPLNDQQMIDDTNRYINNSSKNKVRNEVKHVPRAIQNDPRCDGCGKLAYYQCILCKKYLCQYDGNCHNNPYRTKQQKESQTNDISKEELSSTIFEWLDDPTTPDHVNLADLLLKKYQIKKKGGL